MIKILHIPQFAVLDGTPLVKYLYTTVRGLDESANMYQETIKSVFNGWICDVIIARYLPQLMQFCMACTMGALLNDMLPAL